MTPDQIQAALAEALQAIRLSDVDGFLINPENTNRMAKAVMALVGPKPLVWDVFDGHRGAKATAWGKASYLIIRWSDGRFEVVESYPGYQGSNLSGGFLPTLELAQAAAQAHADAAHWANTALADMIGGGSDDSPPNHNPTQAAYKPR